jgi:hypothetical protein
MISEQTKGNKTVVNSQRADSVNTSMNHTNALFPLSSDYVSRTQALNSPKEFNTNLHSLDKKFKSYFSNSDATTTNHRSFKRDVDFHIRELKPKRYVDIIMA